jgi:hypothetical protein
MLTKSISISGKYQGTHDCKSISISGDTRGIPISQTLAKYYRYAIT